MSSLQPHPYSLALGASALVAVCVGALAWRRRAHQAAAVPLATLMGGLAIWSGTYAVGWASTTASGQHLFLNLTYIGVGIVPASFYLFSRRMTGLALPRRVGWLVIGPVAALASAWFNPAHLFYPQMHLMTAHGRAELAWSRGPLFWASAGYAYALMVASTVVLCRGLSRAVGLYRRQRLFVLGAALIPWLANAATESGLWRVGNLDTTPVAFTATGALIALALLRARLLDLVPVARDAIVEIMADGMLVLDGQGRIVDINPAAREMVRSIWPDITLPLVGALASEVWDDWPPVATMTDGLFSRHVEAGGGRDLDIVVSRLRPRGADQDAVVLVVRDVTERNRTQHQLEAANAELRSKLVEIERLQARLADEATRDPLTDLFNRRYLDRALERELMIAAREGSEVSLVILDVDHFKDLNDQWGHSAGDEALRSIAEMLRRTTRACDTACRWGGEEFVVVLPGAGANQAALRAAAWIRGGGTVTCTLSAGVATFPTHGITAEELLRSADRALYQAKQTGRARVVAA